MEAAGCTSAPTYQKKKKFKPPKRHRVHFKLRILAGKEREVVCGHLGDAGALCQDTVDLLCTHLT